MLNNVKKIERFFQKSKQGPEKISLETQSSSFLAFKNVETMHYFRDIGICRLVNLDP